MKLKPFNKNLLNVETDENGNLKAFTISRQYWGTGKEGGSLLNPQGKMCCLGFASLACRMSKNAIRNECFPGDVLISSSSNTIFLDLRERLSRKIRVEKGLSSADAILAEVNDAETGFYKSVEKKEKRITNIFKAIGIAVTFVD